MEKIVTKPLKVDFHIHSYASHFKDGDVVLSGTKDNISTLLNAIKSHNVDAFSITDHDCFDKELYSELKKHEGVEFKKIFPGVEFSVWMGKEKKQIHVIAIFDDSKNENIDKIANIIGYKKDKCPSYDVIEHKCFSESAFRNLMFDIGVNAILIVHQKGSALPNANPSKSDLKSLGNEKMNELINLEYFDAMEYKKPSQQVFQTLFANSINSKSYDLVKFITGSDCHQWEHYPMHDSSTGDSELQYSYLKCLPNFRGLVMSVTDYSRISCSDQVFDNVDSFVDNLSLSIRGEDIVIPLSKGINVIIGDNSTGKSAILHKITKYSKIDGTTGLNLDLKSKYENFFKSNNIIVKTEVDISKCDFSVQGGIRYKFEQGNFFEEFSKDKYPEATDPAQYKTFISNALSPFYESIMAKHHFDNVLSSLPNIVVAEKPDKSKICKATSCPQNALQKTKDISSLVSNISNLIQYYDKILDKITVEEEKNTLLMHKAYLQKLGVKYTGIKEYEKHLEGVISALNLGIENYTQQYKQLFDSSETKYSSFQTAVDTLSADIPNLIKTKKEIIPFNYDSVGKIEIKYNETPYGDIKFCSRFAKQIKIIDSNYIKALVQNVFKEDCKNIDVLKATEEQLNSAIKIASTEDGKSGVELLKSKIDNQIKEDFLPKRMLTKSGEDCTAEYSAGFNSSMYFSFVSNDAHRKHLLIVDQPEDDISQSNISDVTIPDFRKMSGKRQVIIVTHNPQFVVNLDADNIIYFKKDDNGISIKSGALEYKDESFDALLTVEKSLDGGEESIKKRWRRYEKGN